jgi:hypothetical protein
MSQLADKPDLTPRIRVMQLIITALVMGVLFFMGIAIFQRASGNPPVSADQTLLTIALAVAAVMVFARCVVPGWMTSSARRQLLRQKAEIQDGRLLNIYQTQMIAGAALLEGPIFLLLIVYLIQGQLLSLAAGVLLTVGLALQFPTLAGVERWLERQRELLAGESALG